MKLLGLLLAAACTWFAAAQEMNTKFSLLIALDKGSQIKFVSPAPSSRELSVVDVKSRQADEYAVTFLYDFADLINSGGKSLTVVFDVKKKTRLRSVKFVFSGQNTKKEAAVAVPFDRYGKFNVYLSDLTLNGSMLLDRSEPCSKAGEVLVFGAPDKAESGVELKPGKRYYLRTALKCKADFTAIGALNLNMSEPGAVEITDGKGRVNLDKSGKSLQITRSYPANSVALGGKCRLLCRLKAKKDCRITSATFETRRYAGTFFTRRYFHSILNSLSVNGKKISSAPVKGNWRGGQELPEIGIKLKAGKTYIIDAELQMPSTDVYYVCFFGKSLNPANMESRGIGFNANKVKDGMIYQCMAQLDRNLLNGGGTKQVNFVLIPEKTMTIDRMWFDVSRSIGGVRQYYCPGSLTGFTVNGLTMLKNPVEITNPSNGGAVISDNKMLLEARREYNVQLTLEFSSMM